MIQDYLSALRWRYATKKYDVNKKIPADIFTDLLEALRLAPSSFGLTPYRVYRITDSALRIKLQEKAFGQSPIVEASDILVFAVPLQLDLSWVDAFFETIKQVRSVSDEMLIGYKKMVADAVQGRSEVDRQTWAAKQAYLGLGFLLSAAANFGIDATPMEGFDPAGVDDVLELGKDGMMSVVICALGYRAQDDQFASYAKVRFDLEELVKVK